MPGAADSVRAGTERRESLCAGQQMPLVKVSVQRVSGSQVRESPVQYVRLGSSRLPVALVFCHR